MNNTDDIYKQLDEVLYQKSISFAQNSNDKRFYAEYDVEVLKQSLHQLIQSEYKRGWEDAMKQENPPERLSK